MDRLLRTRVGARDPVRRVAFAAGIVFLVVGALGFVPGVTTGWDTIEPAGHSSHAMLLGMFATSVLHNVIHLTFGVLGLVASRTARGSALFLALGGVAYLLLWAYGLATPDESALNALPVNAADDWLHLALGVAMITALLVTRRPEPRHARAAPPPPG
ncbi:DUF4383 domain-containing protein [Rhodococcus sp. NPDC003318]|uniref:DUF4383 domain-containing protein n=1 Tax=Rhodococcus sp. NPDC003318 TaxID=3364503 RepID=UPI0036BB80DC